MGMWQFWPMGTVYVVTTLTTAIVAAGIAVADFIPARFVRANSVEVGVPRSDEIRRESTGSG
jgi:hypothetical protein